jgi:hypothetical protein
MSSGRFCAPLLTFIFINNSHGEGFSVSR